MRETLDGVAMTEHELLVLVFAPATVGLVVMSVRGLPRTLYLASLVGIIALIVASLGGYPPSAGGSVFSHLSFLAVFVIVPTIAAFGVGRFIARSLGGAYVFTASCTAYVFGLALTAGISGFSRTMAF